MNWLDLEQTLSKKAELARYAEEPSDNYDLVHRPKSSLMRSVRTTLIRNDIHLHLLLKAQCSTIQPALLHLEVGAPSFGRVAFPQTRDCPRVPSSTFRSKFRLAPSEAPLQPSSIPWPTKATNTTPFHPHTILCPCHSPRADKMPSPTELLEKKIRHREDILRARDAETAAREAELKDLKESLRKLQSARRGIRAAIEDGLSGNLVNPIAPTDLLEMAVEGHPNYDPFANGKITADEALCLALISMKDDLGRRSLVKMIIQMAVSVSHLDAEGVIKTALEAVRACDLTSADVIRVALQASRNADHIFAADIIAPAVATAIEIGIAPPDIVRQAFVSAVRRDPSLARTSVLSVLGCALGMGMGYGDIKEILEAFLREMELAEEVDEREGTADSPSGTFDANSTPDPNRSPLILATLIAASIWFLA